MKKSLICTCNKVHDADETKQQAEAASRRPPAGQREPSAPRLPPFAASRMPIRGASRSSVAARRLMVGGEVARERLERRCAVARGQGPAWCRVGRRAAGRRRAAPLTVEDREVEVPPSSRERVAQHAWGSNPSRAVACLAVEKRWMPWRAATT